MLNDVGITSLVLHTGQSTGISRSLKNQTKESIKRYKNVRKTWLSKYCRQGNIKSREQGNVIEIEREHFVRVM